MKHMRVAPEPMPLETEPMVIIPPEPIVRRKHSASISESDKPPQTPADRRKRYQASNDDNKQPKKPLKPENIATILIFLLIGVITVCVVEIAFMLPKKEAIDSYTAAQQQVETDTNTETVSEAPKPSRKTDTETNVEPEATEEPETNTDSKSDSESESKSDDKTEPESEPESKEETKQEPEIAPIPDVTYPGVLIVGSAHVAQYSDALKTAFPGATIITDPAMRADGENSVVSNIASTENPTCIIIDSGDNEETGLWNKEIEAMTTIYRNTPTYIMTLDPKSPNAGRTSDSINNLMEWHDWIHVLDFGSTDMSAKTLVSMIQEIAPNESV